MRWQKFTVWFLLFLAGFAFTLIQASHANVRSTGNLWLLASLVLAVALIAAALSAIADFHATFSRSLPPTSPTTSNRPSPAILRPRNAATTLHTAHPAQQQPRDPNPQGS